MTTSSLQTNLDEERLLAVLTAIKEGDFSERMPTGAAGTAGQIADTVNALLDQLQSFESETGRVTREIGSEGRFGGQAVVTGLSGSWRRMTDNLNSMAGNLTHQHREIARTITAIANGDLATKVEMKAEGEVEELKTTINLMVDQLNSFAYEVTYLVRQMGTEGRFGGQAEVKGIAGTWKDLLTNINRMAFDLTVQIRSIADVTLAVAKGDLAKHITAEMRGEMGDLKNLINTMVDQVNVLMAKFTRIARELGTEGKFGGQAEEKGFEGDWKHLVENINFMSANLTSQVRDLTRTAYALVEGDTSHKVTIRAAGETVLRKDAINTLVDQHSQSRR